MKVLVACEYSGIVRDAFENAGWDAWSCDLLPTESEQTAAAGKHVVDSVEFLLYADYEQHVEASAIFGEYDGFDALIQQAKRMPKDWDLLIGHPPCTYLSFAYTGKERYSNERLQKKIDAYQFFLDLWNAPIEHICLENPFGYVHSGLLPYTQKIEPYYWGKEFGEDYYKRTCLWLKNLPLLKYSKENTLFEEKTAVTPKFRMINNKNTKNGLPSMFDRADAKERSKFHKGVAKAMAEQWTEYIKNIKNQ